MKRLWEFFQEANGQLSNMRLNSSLAVWTGLFQVYAKVFWGTPIDYQVMYLLLGAGFGFKLFQKFAEGKAETSIESK
jgi:hypothetical protein